jgi:hypothetical protein
MQIQHKHTLYNMKRILQSTTVLILLAGQLWAQESDEQLRIAYENALLDSTYRYELLKPTFYNLKSAYEYQGQEIKDLRNAMRLLELQNTVQRQNFETQLAEYKKRSNRLWWRGFKVGGGTGFAIGFLAGLSAH